MCLTGGDRLKPELSMPRFTNVYVAQKVAAHGKDDAIVLANPAYGFLRLTLIPVL